MSAKYVILAETEKGVHRGEELIQELHFLLNRNKVPKEEIISQKIEDTKDMKKKKADFCLLWVPSVSRCVYDILPGKIERALEVAHYCIMIKLELRPPNDLADQKTLAMIQQLIPIAKRRKLMVFSWIQEPTLLQKMSMAMIIKNPADWFGDMPEERISAQVGNLRDTVSMVGKTRDIGKYQHDLRIWREQGNP